MLLAIRMLTLIAFTAHAVLGCCLSHGSCMREQSAVLNGHICDHHDHDCDAHEDDEDQSHDNPTSEPEFRFVVNCDAYPVGSHDHSKHCDDATCVFGVISSPTSMSDLQFVADAIWIDGSVDFWLLSARNSDFVDDWLKGPTRAPYSRAVLQVWTI